MIKLTKFNQFSFFMKIFPNESYEPENFRIWNSGVLYDLSHNWLKNITKNDLVDLLTNGIFWLEKNKIKKLNNEELKDILRKKLLKLYKPENIELFWLKDPRKTNLSNEEKEKYKQENFPKHIWIWLPHWSYKLPKITRREIINEIKEKVKNELNLEDYSKEVRNEVKKELAQFYRIMKNFSDFWTTEVVKKSKLIPNDQIFSAKYSRWTIDSWRSLDEKQMKKDFYWNDLLKSIEGSYKIWILEHAVLHLKINNFIENAIKKYWGSIYIDRHDTWVNDIDKNSENDKYNDWGFPIISLWTLDWESCNPEIVEYYAERIEYHLWVKPLINSPYKWWYVTQKHWRDRRNKLKEEWKNPWINNVIQIEVLKSLYLDEETQIIDKDKAEWIWVWLARAEIDVWLKFNKNYFKNLK